MHAWGEGTTRTYSRTEPAILASSGPLGSSEAVFGGVGSREGKPIKFPEGKSYIRLRTACKTGPSRGTITKRKKSTARRASDLSRLEPGKHRSGKKNGSGRYVEEFEAGKGGRNNEKNSILIPLVKKEERKKVRDYRGITLMPSVYKVYVSVLIEKTEGN